MIVGIIGWFLGNPLGQKIGIVILCALAAVGALWTYGRGRYNAGKTDGIVVGMKDLEKQKQEEWARIDAANKAKADELIQKDAALGKQEQYLERMRSNLTATLGEIRTQAQASQEAANAIVNTIPADQLDDAIRSISVRLGPPAGSAPPPE